MINMYIHMNMHRYQIKMLAYFKEIRYNKLQIKIGVRCHFGGHENK